MWVITGGSGQLGRLVVEKLLARVAATEVGVSVRDVAKVDDFAARGVRVRQGDYDDAASLRHAFEGATQVLLVSSNGRAFGRDSLAQHRNAIEAAKAVGVRRVLYTSHMAASATSAFPPMHDHAATEAMLAASGLAWTSLRNGFYASSGLAMADEGLKRGTLSMPRDGKVSWTTHADLAEAAAVILCNEGRFEGATPPLTASEALDFEAVAAMATEALGRPITREVVDDEAFRARLTALGVPAPRVAISMGFYEASRRGEFAAVKETLATLLGRAPQTMRSLLKA